MVVRRRILDRASHAEKKKEERSGERERESCTYMIPTKQQTSRVSKVKGEERKGGKYCPVCICRFVMPCPMCGLPSDDHMITCSAFD